MVNGMEISFPKEFRILFNNTIVETTYQDENDALWGPILNGEKYVVLLQKTKSCDITPLIYFLPAHEYPEK